MNGGRAGGDRLEVIEVVYTTSTRRVSKAFDRELRQVVSVTSEALLDRDGDELVRALRPFLDLARVPTMAPLLDAYVDGDRLVLISPWIEGVDLLALLQASGTPGLPVTAVLGWLDQLGDAVRHLERHGLVHGDLRPANLVLSSEQRIVVIGLGTGLLEPAPGDARADVRGAAATAAALLTGSSPSVGAITGTANVSGAALQRALLPALDDHGTAAVTIDSLLAGLRHELGAALPTGVVTFLLPDIVGSTRAWEADETSMAARLARHDHLMAEAVEAAGGRLLKARGEGDATFSVFTRASAGVLAALDAMRRLEETGLQVRMAVHTGEAELRDADYFGRTVNRAARLRSVAPDGGILVSSATADLVLDALPDGVRLVDGGARALKDLDRAEHVYQLVGPGLAPEPAAASPVLRPERPPAVEAAPATDGAPVVAATPAPSPPGPTGAPGSVAPAKASTTRRRRTRVIATAVVVAVAAVVGVVVALGGGGGGGGAAAEDTTTSATVAPPIEGLLLADADLPSGLGARQSLGFEDADEACGQPSIDRRVPPTGRAAFRAEGTDGPTTFTEVLRRYSDPSTARRAHDLAVESFTCPAITIVNSSNEPASGTVADMEALPGTGADEASYTSIDFGGFVVGVALGRVDEYAVVVQLGSFDLRGRPLEDEVRTLLVAALERLRPA